MRTVTVEVTQEDIDKGKAYDCLKCPIALALQRATGGLSVWVNPGTWRIRDYSMRWCKFSSEEAAFIEDFDEGRLVEPFHFTVELPD